MNGDTKKKKDKTAQVFRNHVTTRAHIVIYGVFARFPVLRVLSRVPYNNIDLNSIIIVHRRVFIDRLQR